MRKEKEIDTHTYIYISRYTELNKHLIRRGDLTVILILVFVLSDRFLAYSSF